MSTLHDVKLICKSKGLVVTYNGNEINKETVFLFTKENNYIQNMMYDPNINILEYDSLKNNLINSTSEKIDKVFLLYAFHYQISLCHFLSQCIPKLVDFKNLNDPQILLGIPEHTYNNFTIDILNYYGILKDSIFLFKDDTVYNINQLYYVKHYHQWDINDSKLEIFTTLRNNLNINNSDNDKSYRKIYLKRDGKISSTNNEVGIMRKILNEDLLIETLKKHNFEIITLGDKNLEEKKKLLENCDILITQLGANLLNLIFSNLPNKILILSNEYLIGVDFYTRLLSLLNNKVTNYKVLHYLSIKNTYKKYNGFSAPEDAQFNNAFNININEILNNIHS